MSVTQNRKRAARENLILEQSAAPRNGKEDVVNPTCCRAFIVKMDGGLHLRPGAMLVKTAQRFSAPLRVSNGVTEANGKSLMSLITLGAEQGDRLRIVAEGPDAEALVDAIGELFEDGFGETCMGFAFESAMMTQTVAA
jgi:phosphotransferase system HPr (HPr) family protein